MDVVTVFVKRLVVGARRRWSTAAGLISLIPHYGLVAVLQYVVISRRCHPDRHSTGLWRIRLSRWGQPVVGRYGTSDMNVFRQIFIEREHDWARSLPRLPDAPCIIDCGANVGYASVFFLRLFPTARVIAVEPDERNFAILAMNLRHTGARAVAIRAGVWSHATTLKCCDAPYRDGMEWSRQVVECVADDPAAFQAVSIGDLVRQANAPRINILKIDIEGAESVVFEDVDRQEWLDRTDAIAIELHDDTIFGPASEVFMRAIAGQGFQMGTSGELTLATRGFQPPVGSDA